MPQGSVLGPILCNTLLGEPVLILIDIDIFSYTNENTKYKASNSIDTVVEFWEY